MNKNFTNYQDPLQKGTVVQTLKLLVFPVGKLQISLPVMRVQKVINYTHVYGSGLSYLGVAHIGDDQITVIDLHQKLFHQSQMIQSGTKGYLILARNSSSESFGIWIGETPTLIDVPVNRIRELPESYRQGDTLKIASHVTVVEDKQESMTIFILDTDQLVSPSTFREKVQGRDMIPQALI